MASVMATPSHNRFDASFSASVMRPPYHSADAPSMADSLPSIDFGIDELRERMARFTARFDDFIEKGRKRVLEERNHFRLNVAEIQDSQRTRKRDIEHVEHESLAHQHNAEKETQEQEEMHEAISALSARRQDHLARRDELRTQIAEVQKAIQTRRQAQQQHQRQLDSQARHNGPELRFWESSLCLRIEGAGQEDQLKFVFTHVDERDWEKECSFALSMGRKEYEVLGTNPKLEAESVQGVLERLNETRELAGFLKGMRTLFVDAVLIR